MELLDVTPFLQNVVSPAGTFPNPSRDAASTGRRSSAGHDGTPQRQPANGRVSRKRGHGPEDRRRADGITNLENLGGVAVCSTVLCLHYNKHSVH